ncbi:unnamed protein product [Rhizopus stolonifer]
MEINEQTSVKPTEDSNNEKPLKKKVKTFLGKLNRRSPYFRVFLVGCFFTTLIIIMIPLAIMNIRANEASELTAINERNRTMNTPGSPNYRDPFDDSTQANKYTPPLNQSFSYNNKHRIRGINLGGWLVMEPFITPKLFEQQIGSDTSLILDEWTLCERLGPEEARRQLQEHYETFITEEDFKKIAEMGFNHVRIPTGHWAMRVFSGEPYVPYISWQYLLKGIQWARKYGLRVMVELHTAPGSQNGWNHSGRVGQVGFLNGTDGELNAERTLGLVTEMIQFFNKPEWSHVVPVFGVLNEPAMMKIPAEKVKQWYRKSYDAIRNMIGPGSGPLLTYHDGFFALNEWHGFFKNGYERAVLETHLYLIFNNDLVAMPRSLQVDFPCRYWQKDLNQSTLLTGPTMVGEFSVATNDCGKYLNGMGLGARFDGTLDQEGMPNHPVCPACTCKGVDDWTKFTTEYKQFLLEFMEKQMDAYESGIGWFYWTYKTEDHINPHWDYLLAWEQGFAPKDVNVRKNTCATVKPEHP